MFIRSFTYRLLADGGVIRLRRVELEFMMCLGLHTGLGTDDKKTQGNIG